MLRVAYSELVVVRGLNEVAVAVGPVDRTVHGCAAIVRKGLGDTSHRGVDRQARENGKAERFEA